MPKVPVFFASKKGKAITLLIVVIALVSAAVIAVVAVHHGGGNRESAAQMSSAAQRQSENQSHSRLTSQQGQSHSRPTNVAGTQSTSGSSPQPATTDGSGGEDYVELFDPQKGENYCELVTNFFRFTELSSQTSMTQTYQELDLNLQRIEQTSAKVAGLAKDSSEARAWQQLAQAARGFNTQLKGVSSPGDLDVKMATASPTDGAFGSAYTAYVSAVTNVMEHHGNAMAQSCGIAVKGP